VVLDEMRLDVSR